MEEFKKTLRHTDPMVLDDFGASLPFVSIYLSTLDNQDNTLNKCVTGPHGFSNARAYCRPQEMEGLVTKVHGGWVHRGPP